MIYLIDDHLELSSYVPSSGLWLYYWLLDVQRLIEALREHYDIR